MHSGNFYEMYVSVLWKYFNSGKDLGSEHITDLRSGLETLYSSLKSSKEFECLVTDREKRSQLMGSYTAMPLEQVTVKLKGDTMTAVKENAQGRI